MKPDNTYYAGYGLRIIILEQRALELRYNHNHDDRGRFTFSSGGSSAPKKVDKSRESGIIKENGGKKSITEITDKAIESVPNVGISGYTEKQCAMIQDQHKELLKYARDNNDCNEVAFVFDSSLQTRNEFIGADDKLDFGKSFYGRDLLVMHNHPRNSSYSDTDIAFLISNDNVKTLTIVKNSGSVETLTKTKSYRKDTAINEFKRQYKKYVKTGSENEIQKAIVHFISSEKGGFEWKRT